MKRCGHLLRGFGGNVNVWYTPTRVQILLILESVENPLRSPQPTYLKCVLCNFCNGARVGRGVRCRLISREVSPCLFFRKKGLVFRKFRCARRSATLAIAIPRCCTLRGPLSPPQTPRQNNRKRAALSSSSAASHDRFRRGYVFFNQYHTGLFTGTSTHSAFDACLAASSDQSTQPQPRRCSITFSWHAVAPPTRSLRP